MGRGAKEGLLERETAEDLCPGRAAAKTLTENRERSSACKEEGAHREGLGVSRKFRFMLRSR